MTFAYRTRGAPVIRVDCDGNPWINNCITAVNSIVNVATGAKIDVVEQPRNFVFSGGAVFFDHASGVRCMYLSSGNLSSEKVEIRRIGPRNADEINVFTCGGNTFSFYHLCNDAGEYVIRRYLIGNKLRIYCIASGTFVDFHYNGLSMFVHLGRLYVNDNYNNETGVAQLVSYDLARLFNLQWKLDKKEIARYGKASAGILTGRAANEEYGGQILSYVVEKNACFVSTCWAYTSKLDDYSEDIRDYTFTKVSSQYS